MKLLMLTAQRRDEIASLRWSEIDTEAKTITLPASRTKNGREHVIPLSAQALAIIQATPQRANRDLVFGSGDGGYSGWSKAKAAMDENWGRVWPVGRCMIFAELVRLGSPIAGCSPTSSRRC